MNHTCRYIDIVGNDYSDTYSNDILEQGLTQTISENNSKHNSEIITKIINVYAQISDRYSSGVWSWINKQQDELFDHLQSKDIKYITTIFSNFFRNKNISNGLVSHNLLKNDNEITENVQTKKQFLNLILQDIDTCMELTGLKDISELDFPRIGNPYGVIIQNTLIPPDQPRHYYDAKKIFDITSDIEHPVILEIGGGYGGLLINLFKVFKNKKFTYINCDIMPTIFLFMYTIEHFIKQNNLNTSVYFNKSNNIDKKTIKEHNIILTNYSKNKTFECAQKIDLVFNSHSLSEMAIEDVTNYMDIINNNKSKYFYHINSNYFPWKESKKGHKDINASEFPIKNFKKLQQSISPWICGGHSRYREFLYERID